MIETAVIIAGGEGSRLKPLSNNKPKTMVEINGQPMLYWIIRWLTFHGIKKLVIGVAYRKERILSYMKANHNFGLNAQFSVHTLEDGTDRGFGLAISRFVTDDNFVAMNCDEVINMDLGTLVLTHEQKQPLVTMALAPFYCRFSVVDTRPDGFINGFKYGHMLEDAPISIGIYVFNRRLQWQRWRIGHQPYVYLQSVHLARGRIADICLRAGHDCSQPCRNVRPGRYRVTGGRHPRHWL